MEALRADLGLDRMDLLGHSAGAHGAGVEMDGQFIQGPALMAQCRAISLTGLPSLAMPTMATGGGRTTRVQVVGPPGGDELCCSVAAEIAAELSLRRSATVRSEGVL